MSKATQTQQVNTAEFNAFLCAEKTSDRLAILSKWKMSGRSIDESLLRALMIVPLSRAEIVGAFEICSTTDKSAFELWVMNNLLAWEQNVAAVAIRAWSRITDRILWHRLIPVAMMPGLPQRIRYTILDIAPTTHGHELVSATIQSHEWEDLSPAFHALIFERALEFDISSAKLDKLAWSMIKENSRVHHPENKALISAIAWLTRHQESELEKWSDMADCPIWVEMVKACLHKHSSRQSQFSKIIKALAKATPDGADFEKRLPSTWSRHDADEKILSEITRLNNVKDHWVFGFSRSVIKNAMSSTNPENPWFERMLLQLPFDSANGPAANGPLGRSYDGNRFPELQRSRASAARRTLPLNGDPVKKWEDFSSDAPVSFSADKIRHGILNVYDTFSGGSTPIDDHSPWGKLSQAWMNPDRADLNSLAAEARKHKGVFALAHIKCLSRFKGRDEAVLKLLDYVRSDDETELRAVVRSLGEINSQRSLLELISMLTRPNATVVVQQDIVGILGGKDLNALQKELRSAVHDLVLPLNTDHPVYQIRDELTALLTPVAGAVRESKASNKIQASSSGGDETNLDRELAAMIPHFKELSSEVKRALRTALFFQRTVDGSAHQNEIDLSPLIDMQYKAMELLYRELFEDIVSQSLQKGTIQRKLDVIGYARPIVRQMDDFESYIATLPVVREIPFFSKFKLRKMLRAICQFEPGRRFTLDGLKAFGLYFLIFGRQECKYNLSGLFQSGAQSDAELAELCRELHVFQDFRNRAAHEGFHPDASNDVMGIWRTTASAVQWAFKIKDAQKSATNTANAPRSVS